MIKLILPSFSPPLECVFQKNLVTIGGSQEGDVDLPLPLHESVGILVLLVDEREYFTATALSQDIFLNGKILTTAHICSGDELLIKNIQCCFVGDSDKNSFEREELLLKDEELEAVWQSLQREPEKKRVELHPLLLEVETLSSESSSSQETVNKPAFTTSSHEHHKQNGTALLLWCFSAILFFGLFSVGSYLYLQEKNEREEIMAARGLADLAMALTHARLHSSPLSEVFPPLQTELSHEFFAPHFEAVLASKERISSEIDMRGCLKDDSYQCQIYAVRDLSRFLLIAEPKMSWLQSLFPKPYLIITSQKMEVRRTFNIRPWLELLGSAKSIEAIHPKELNALANQQELLPLPMLDFGTRKEGFTPPQLLAQLRPEAENRIYNAPRYSLFAAPLLQRALELENEEHNEFASAELRYLAQQYASLDHLILYTHENAEKIEKVQDVLQQALPAASLLIGTITTNPQTGLILSAGLLACPGSETEAKAADSRMAIGSSSTSIYAMLSEIVQARRIALQPISQQVSDLLASNNSRPLPDFTERLDHLTRKYLLASQEQSHRIEDSLESICEQFSNEEEIEKLPLVAATIKATGLESYIPSSVRQKLSADNPSMHTSQLSPEKLIPETCIQEILNGSLGFLRSDSNLIKQQEALLDNYINAKEKLLSTQRRSLYRKKLKQFKKCHLSHLHALLNNAQNLQQASQELDKQMHLYLQKLRFSQNYNSLEHSEMQRLEKIKMAEHLESQVHMLAYTFSSISQEYQTFVESEIADLDNSHAPTHEQLDALKQKKQNLFYPSHAMESLAASLHALFSQ